MAFSGKVKTIKSYIPEKVKVYIEQNLQDELKYFEKKYLFKIELIPEEKLIIPEYKIELLNKSKKVLNKVENINTIDEIKVNKKTILKERKDTKKNKKDSKKIKSKKKPRTLWVRRKKS